MDRTTPGEIVVMFVKGVSAVLYRAYMIAYHKVTGRDQ